LTDLCERTVIGQQQSPPCIDLDRSQNRPAQSFTNSRFLKQRANSFGCNSSGSFATDYRQEKRIRRSSRPILKAAGCPRQCSGEVSPFFSPTEPSFGFNQFGGRKCGAFNLDHRTIFRERGRAHGWPAPAPPCASSGLTTGVDFRNRFARPVHLHPVTLRKVAVTLPTIARAV